MENEGEPLGRSLGNMYFIVTIVSVFFMLLGTPVTYTKVGRLLRKTVTLLLGFFWHCVQYNYDSISV